MSDEATMRARLQTVAAYRQLCRSVQRGGRENVLFAVIFAVIAYFAHEANVAEETLLLYGALVAAELLIGLFKWAFPSAEAMILDGVILVVFAALNFGRAYVAFQNGRQPNPADVFIGFLMLLLAVNRFRLYGHLRALFADRPSPEHMAWFDDLVREIHSADPVSDELALDLPTSPHWKARLLGSTAFFVSASGNDVWVAGPEDFVLEREKADRGTGRRRARLRIHGEMYPEFVIEDASWVNYVKWVTAHVVPQPPA
jgi:hypothetical protein